MHDDVYLDWKKYVDGLIRVLPLCTHFEISDDSYFKDLTLYISRSGKKYDNWSSEVYTRFTISGILETGIPMYKWMVFVNDCEDSDCCDTFWNIDVEKCPGHPKNEAMAKLFMTQNELSEAGIDINDEEAMLKWTKGIVAMFNQDVKMLGK